MAGLISNLHAGARALVTHGKGLEVAGKNIANISNPAYARQRVILGDRVTIETPLGMESSGLEARGLRKLRDAYLDRQIVRESGATAALRAQQGILQRAEVALGQQLDRSNDASSVANSPLSSGRGLTEAISDFFNAFESLSARPGDAGEKHVLLQKAGILVEKFNSADARLAQVQADVTANVSNDVSVANGILDEVARLNGEIARAENGRPESAVDLRDQRQAKLEALAEHFDFEARPIPDSNGQVQIVVKDSANADVVLVDKLFVRGPIAFDGTTFTGGSPVSALAFSFGSLPAQVATRDGAVQLIRDDLSSLAAQMRESVNGAYNPTNSTGNFFATAPTGLLAFDAALSAATLKTSDSPDESANDISLAVAALANTRFNTANGGSIDGTPTEFLATVVSRVGQELASATAQLENQELMQRFVAEQRDGVSGVSMDEEMTDLMKFQRAFQASARFVNTVDELLELVVTRLGA